MKNIVGASLVAVLMVGSAVAPASALTIEEIQSQLKELLGKVATLTAQMNQLKSQGAPAQTVQATPIGVVGSSGYSHRVCALLNRNLSQGMSGDDVRGMQEFLQGEGFLAASPTGYFGPITAQAIAKWQAKEGLAQAGVFGPMSRERIKRWCGGGGSGDSSRLLNASPTRGAAPLTVRFTSALPDPGAHMIDFGDGSTGAYTICGESYPYSCSISHTYSVNGTYTAILYRNIPGGCGPNADPRCLGAPAENREIARVQIIVGTQACTKEYNPVCGLKQVVCVTAPCNPIQQTYGNRCVMEADGATFVHAGECRGVWDDPAQNPQCKSWYDGCNTCGRETPTSPAMCTLRACFQQEKAYCTGYFDSSTTNKPPTISGFSGPTTLSVNQTGTWTIQASDPENGQLSYSIRWGDEVNVYPIAAMSAERAFTQTTSFTHSYAKAGTYTVSIVVQDPHGKTAEAKSTVVVGGGNVVCTQEYAPVCGRLPGCVNTCPAGGYCAMMCQMHPAITYSNRCHMNAAGAEFIHQGACTSSSGTY